MICRSACPIGDSLINKGLRSNEVGLSVVPDVFEFERVP